jgi:hypothetical protein
MIMMMMMMAAWSWAGVCSAVSDEKTRTASDGRLLQHCLKHRRLPRSISIRVLCRWCLWCLWSLFGVPNPTVDAFNRATHRSAVTTTERDKARWGESVRCCRRLARASQAKSGLVSHPGVAIGRGCSGRVRGPRVGPAGLAAEMRPANSRRRTTIGNALYCTVHVRYMYM